MEQMKTELCDSDPALLAMINSPTRRSAATDRDPLPCTQPGQSEYVLLGLLEYGIGVSQFSYWTNDGWKQGYLQAIRNYPGDLRQYRDDFNLAG